MSLERDMYLEKSEKPELCILLPVHFEEKNLRILLRVLGALIDVSHEVLIVYDVAEDTSRHIPAEFSQHFPEIRAIQNTIGRGVLNAVRTGIDAAKADTILIYAADELQPAYVINDMYVLIKEGCELVSCTRYGHGGRRYGGSALGHFLSLTANRLYRIASGCVLSDVTTGIKMFRKEIFNHITLESKPIGWAFAFEMSVKAHTLNFQLGEVPIVSIDRLFNLGTSSFKPGPWIKEYLRWFFWGIKNRSKMGQIRGHIIRQPDYCSLTPPILRRPKI